MMFVEKKDRSIICTTCNVPVKKLRDYEADQHRNDPDWFWEPFDQQDNYLYVCPKCKNKDFISDTIL